MPTNIVTIEPADGQTVLELIQIAIQVATSAKCQVSVKVRGADLTITEQTTPECAAMEFINQLSASGRK